tara:strand:- start:3059 stop:3622 length:564 start_codon:yes stop_codon:yes gene_type:complete
MRIISGTAKGKKIIQPDDKSTRPLKDLTKESIFNIIEHSNLFDLELKGSSILDLFSGVGSFGLECLSRGASSVIFVENYGKVLPILKKNIDNLNFNENSKISEINLLDESPMNFLKKKFDIIFLDPPYKEKELSNLLEKLIHLNFLEKGGIFIIHRHKKEEDIFPKNFKILKEKSYGISKIIFGTLS